MSLLETWSCTACTFVNASQHLACKICSEERPERPSSHSPSNYISNNNNPQIKPEIGNIVHALFWEDEKYYPAEIVNVDASTGAIRVRYLKFENYEWVSLNEIGPGFGNELSEKAMAEEGQCNVFDSDSFGDDVKADHKGGKGGGGSSSNTSNNNRSHRSHRSHRSTTHQTPRALGTRLRKILGSEDHVGIVVLTGKQGEIFKVNGSNSRGGQVHRLARLAPSGGSAQASASRRGGQSALRFSRLADGFRLAWVKKVVETMNGTLVEKNDDGSGSSNKTSTLKKVLVCGGGGLKLIFGSEPVVKEIHHTLRDKIMFVSSGIDPIETQRGKKLRKVNSSSSNKKDDDSSTKTIGTMLLDHELRDLIVTVMTE